jgi:N-acetylmuramoyl-L-alanine amidase
MMKKILILLFFTFLFACNTSSVNSAYNDYYKYQQKYISALLDNNKNEEIKALKGLIECGRFLKFNVKNYEEKLKKLQKKQKLTSTINIKPSVKKPISSSRIPSNKIIKSKYIKIYSYSPLKIKIPNKDIKYFTINSKLYKKVFDLKNAVISKPIFKKMQNKIFLKIAQFNKKTVRIVFYSKKKIYS